MRDTSVHFSEKKRHIAYTLSITIKSSRSRHTEFCHMYSQKQTQMQTRTLKAQTHLGSVNVTSNRLPSGMSSLAGDAVEGAVVLLLMARAAALFGSIFASSLSRAFRRRPYLSV